MPLFIPAPSGPRRAARSDRIDGGAVWSPVVAFFVGLILFVVVIGALDSRLPWPRQPTSPGAP